MADVLKHRFGVNYTPSADWYYFWNNFDASSVARDLDTIAAIGADHIRLMVIWPWFQPNPSWVSPLHLERLGTVLRLCAERRLDVCLTLLNGFLSGYVFMPHFGRHPKLYGDDATFAAQSVYFAGIASVAREHANVCAIDLGNEINCCWQAQDDAGDRWFTRSMDLCATLFPGILHVNGVDHQPWFGRATFSPALLAARQETIALHCWPEFTGAHKRGGPLDDPSVRLGAAMTVLARAYAGDPAKPVWIQEYGCCREWLADDKIPRFLEAYTLAAMAAGASWFTWWDSHDINPKFSFGVYEYSLGLITNDNRIKPQGHAFKALADAHRGAAVTIPPPRKAALKPPVELTPDSTWKWLLEWMGGC